MASHSRFSLWNVVTFLVAAFALIIALPNSWKSWAPEFFKPELHLGLDLAGGTQLDFRISEDEIVARKAALNEEIAKLKDEGNNQEVLQRQLDLQNTGTQHANLVEAIRAVLERRINSLGVSEATITPSYYGSEKHLLVECPGVIDVQKCIATVGKTIQMEFKEEHTGASEEYIASVRARADRAFQTITTGTGSLQVTGQDLSTTLGVTYLDTQPFFFSDLPEQLKVLWSKKKSDKPFKIEAATPTVKQNEKGQPELVEVKAVYIGQVVEDKKKMERTLSDPTEALQHLNTRFTGSTLITKTGSPLSEQPATLQKTLSGMTIGNTDIVTVSPTESSLVFLQGRVDGTEEMKASHILVSYKGANRAEASVTRTADQAQAKIEEISARLKKGEDFNAIARSESDGPSKAQAGSLGTIKRGDIAPTFEAVAFGLKKGEISEPVETPFGFHIIRADEPLKRSATTVTYTALTMKGSDASAQATRAKEQLEKGEIKRMEDALTLRLLVFSLEPTGWKDTALNGQRFRSASVTTDPLTGVPVVQIQFDAEGAKLFQELTKNNIGKRIAIFVGGDLVSAPTVSNEISGGSAVITGSRTFEEAQTLAQDLNTGAIPAPIYLSGQSTIEATLGADALSQSVFAGAVGLLILGIAMVILYRGLGLMANIGLAFYVILMIAFMKLPFLLISNTYIVLTLAGIAGLILSMGIAVDANVLAFERVKEELKKGKLMKTAIETGFKRAWPSVRDGNASTLITCAILFLIGTSIIRGFAITLALGILVSLFTALIVARWLSLKLAATALGKRSKLMIGVDDKIDN